MSRKTRAGGSTRSAHRAANSRTTSSTSTGPGTSTGASSSAAAGHRHVGPGSSASWPAAAAPATRASSGGGGSADTAVKAGGKQVAVKPGGTLKLGMSPGPSTEIDPVMVADEGGLGVMLADRRVPVWSDSKLQLQPRLAESWKPNADGSVWTFKIRQGVKFHDGTPMTAEDVASTINALVGPEERLERAVDVRRRAVEGLGEGDRREHGRVPARRAERQLPVPASARTTTTRSSSRRTSTGSGRRPSRAPARGSSRTTRPNSGVSYVREPGLLGQDADPEARPPAVKFYAKEQAQILALQGGDVDVARPLLADRRQGAAQRPERHGHRAARRRSTARSTCATTRSRSTTSACARRWRSRSTARRSSTASWPASPTSATTARSRRCSRRPTRASPQRKQDLEKAKPLHAAGRRRAARRSRSTRGTASSSPTSPSCCRTTRRRSGIKLKLERHARGHVLRRRGLRQVAVAGLDHGHHRLRPPRRAERVPRRAAAEQGRVERGALQEPDVRRARRRTTSRRSTCRRSGRRRRRSRSCCSTRRRSSITYFYYFLTGTKKNVGDVEATAMGHYRHQPKAGFTAAA